MKCKAVGWRKRERHGGKKRKQETGEHQRKKRKGVPAFCEPGRETVFILKKGQSLQNSSGVLGSTCRTMAKITRDLCNETDLQDGEMREFDVEGHPVLLVKNNGTFSAVGSKCTHYGAPLVKGVLVGDRVRCPWHGACFNIKSGDIEEYPGLDSLPCFKVTVNNGKVTISANKQMLENQKRVKAMSGSSKEDKSKVVIIGTGPASLVCAETLRQENFKGRIIMVTREKHLPYDRTNLSKAMNTQAAELSLRPAEFFSCHNIEVLTEKEAVSVDSQKRIVQLQDGTSLQYDQLLIATGSSPRRLQCPGSELQNVFLLRNPEDANTISESAVGKRVVVVGSSFIGMEVASFLSDKAASVSVVGRTEVPFQAVLGPQIGNVAMKMLQERGVVFHMKSGVAELKGENGKVQEVLLEGGDMLPADVVVAGLGVTPCAGFLQGSEIATDSSGAIFVDQFMRASIVGVFAAGDVASFPLSILDGRRVNIGHWQMAHAHGRIVALNMIGHQVALNSVPFFWTSLLGKSIRYTGYGDGYTDILVKGKPEELSFLAFYIKDDLVVAAASMNFDPAVSQVAEILLTGRKITKEEAQSDDLSWLKRI
ncbi:apoptosis-inducing factor 3-like isoform X4 [Ambystoma mexicanum]|uniref:apoptosis-inducing factor 3-like isoform X4 n=1 Tax=Ambystoma mexicanum TaxID=8296 RepID=UPI0037E6FAFB